MFSELDTESTELDFSKWEMADVCAIDFSVFTKLEKLNISNLYLTKLPSRLPITLKKLICYGNNFSGKDTMAQLSELINLEYLDCSNCKLTSLDNAPPNLKVLISRNNEIQSLDNLPNTLVILSAANNQITHLHNLPPGLLELHCGHNPIEELPNLPLSLKILGCPMCRINNLDCIPDSVERLYCQNNKIIKFARLPARLKEMACFGNPFIYPFTPTLHNIENEISNPVACIRRVDEWEPYLTKT